MDSNTPVLPAEGRVEPIQPSTETPTSDSSRSNVRHKARVASKKKSSLKASKGSAEKRIRIIRNFPTVSFEESLEIANAIHKHAAGGKIRRLTLFQAINKSPDSGTSRMLITNSSKYGLTTGGYHADYLELTPKGRVATDPDSPAKEQLKARFDLALGDIPPFKTLYERLIGNKLPAAAVIHDILREIGVAEDDLAKCTDAFIVNAKFLGLLRTVAGAERLLPVEHVLEEMPTTLSSESEPMTRPVSAGAAAPASAETSDWSKICFYITPIGEEGSDQRRHSDLFLNYVVEPAIEELRLKIVRADQIGKPGMIGAQTVEHILRSRLVIADLSFHNPNVFYELCLRHVIGLPLVQIIREKDKVPFDVQQYRTIPIDNGDIYTLIPKLDVYKSQIAMQARQALDNPGAVDNPITVNFPGLKVTLSELPMKSVTEKVM
jgi:hypothetical protein